MALHRRSDPRRRLVEARIEPVRLERGGEQVTVACGKAAPELRVVEHLAEQGAEAGGKGRVDGQLEVILPGAGAPRAEAGVQVVEDGPPLPVPGEAAEILEVLEPPRCRHPVDVLAVDLEDVIVEIGEHVEVGLEAVAEGVRTGRQAEERVHGRLPGGRRPVLDDPLIEQVHRVVLPPEIVLDELLVGLFPGPIKPPVFTVQVNLHRAPGPGHGVRFDGQLAEEGVLDLVFPAGLSPVAEVEVAEGRDARLGGEDGVVQFAGPLGLEVKAEGPLGLRPGPAAVDLKVEAG